MQGNKAPYSVFLHKYDRSSLIPDPAFAGNDEQAVVETDDYDSQQAVTASNEWVYVAASNARDDQLYIGRYNSTNGAMDDSFAVNETLPDGLESTARGVARVALYADDQYLHLLKYDHEGHIFAVSFDDGQEVYRIARNHSFMNVVSTGPAITNGRMYLAFERPAWTDGMGAVEVVALDMPYLSVNTDQGQWRPQ